MSMPRKPSSVLIISAFMALFIAAGEAQQLLPPPGQGPFQPGEVQKCWSSLTSIQGCVSEISTPFFQGKTGGITPACCQAITKISDNCWHKMFPLNPLFPPFLKTSCSTPTPPAGPKLNAVSKVSIPVYETGSYDVGQCWSSLNKVNGCGTEILESLAGGLMQTSIPISPGCCRAIVKLGHDCWSKMFLPNAFFPFAEDILVWSYCNQA
ncbi:hypothetical protein V6N13_107569 [Hibiscus sabdariffa]|uniref:Prolamin-like domain-containing protein n=1 Tax=Hibiscus sabdariffa TaxID=183260 RepID=A0ABR2SQ00_9ROSI